MAKDFDPDAYLASKTPKEEFNPDAYLASKGSPTAPISSERTLASETQRRIENPLITPASVIEGALTTGTGLVNAAIGGVYGLGTLAATQDSGKAADAVRKILGFTYQPRTESGKRVVEALSLPVEVARAATTPAGRWLGEKTGNTIAGETIGEITPDIVGTLFGGRVALKNAPTKLPSIKEGLKNAKASGERAYTPIQAEKASAAIEKAQLNAHKIEAAKDAQELGIKINPAEVNPTKANALRSSAAGGKPALDAATALENLQVNVPRVARKELGIPEGTVLTPEVFEGVLAKAGEPANKIRSFGVMEDNGTVVSQLNSLRGRKIIGKDESRKAVNALIDDAIETVGRGMTGDDVITNIQQQRADARRALKNDQLTAIERDKANAQIGIANALEKLVEVNLEKVGNKQLLAEYRAGRTLQAKTYTWQEAWNADTGIFDPKIIAKQTAGDSAISGDTAKIGKIANNFEGSMTKLSPTKLEEAVDFVKNRIVRSGPVGIAGTTVGTLLGNPVLGGILGAAAGEVLAPIMQRRVMSPKGQQTAIPPNSSLVSPVDFSTQRPGTAVVTSPEVVGPAEAPITPNWTYGRPDPQVTPMPADMSTPQLGYTPEVGGQLGALRLEDARIRAKSMAEGQAAEVAAAQAAESSRVPTGTGTLYDLDPITGRLVPASQGVKGATPEIFMESTGKTLKSASEKIAKGQEFALTAAEKVAWDKTAVDIREVLPEFKMLSAKEVSAKMADRAWVEQTVSKIKQKEQMFADIEKRAADAASQNLAKIKREQLNDMLTTLEESLGPRPVAKNIQGKKTREFNKNRFNGLNP